MLWKVFVGDKAIPQFLLFSLEQRGPLSVRLFYFGILAASEGNRRPGPSYLPSRLWVILFFFFLFPFAVGSDLPNCKWLCDTLFPEFLVWQFGSVWLCQCVWGNSYQKKKKNAVSNIFLRPSKQHCNPWCCEKFWLYHWYHLPLQQSMLQVLSAKKNFPIPESQLKSALAH